MQVTLKRADHLAKAAMKAVTEPTFDAKLRLSIHSPVLANTGNITDVEREVQKASDKLLRDLQLQEDLIAASYVIRDLLAIANGENGITPRLNRMNRLTLLEGRLKALLKAYDDSNNLSEQSPQTALNKAQSLRDMPKERRMFGGNEDTVFLNAINEQTAETLRRRLKRVGDEKASLKDELTALNVSRSIQLDESTLDALRRADILS